MNRRVPTALVTLLCGAVFCVTLMATPSDLLPVLAMAFQQQDPPPWVPAPGNPGHNPPPDGWSCSRDGNVDPDHNCDCQRHCATPDDNQEPSEDLNIIETPECKVYCFKDHCHCPPLNCP